MTSTNTIVMNALACNAPNIENVATRCVGTLNDAMSGIIRSIKDLDILGINSSEANEIKTLISNLIKKVSSYSKNLPKFSVGDKLEWKNGNNEKINGIVIKASMVSGIPTYIIRRGNGLGDYKYRRDEGFRKIG